MNKEKNQNNVTEQASIANNGYADDTLTPVQVENWRRVLCGMIGPYALMVPVEDIQRFRNKMQNDIDRISKTKSI